MSSWGLGAMGSWRLGAIGSWGLGAIATCAFHYRSWFRVVGANGHLPLRVVALKNHPFHLYVLFAGVGWGKLSLPMSKLE
ncbi:MAG: hypothetical protein VKK04_01285 [Synechococcales bacterium]|nr:hypothetical protein [Synechococcales bacterium]